MVILVLEKAKIQVWDRFNLCLKGLNRVRLISVYTCTLKTVNVILDISLRSKAERKVFCFYYVVRDNSIIVANPFGVRQ